MASAAGLPAAAAVAPTLSPGGRPPPVKDVTALPIADVPAVPVRHSHFHRGHDAGALSHSGSASQSVSLDSSLPAALGAPTAGPPQVALAVARPAQEPARLLPIAVAPPAPALPPSTRSRLAPSVARVVVPGTGALWLRIGRVELSAAAASWAGTGGVLVRPFVRATWLREPARGSVVAETPHLNASFPLPVTLDFGASRLELYLLNDGLGAVSGSQVLIEVDLSVLALMRAAIATHTLAPAPAQLFSMPSSAALLPAGPAVAQCVLDVDSEEVRACVHPREPGGGPGLAPLARALSLSPHGSVPCCNIIRSHRSDA